MTTFETCVRSKDRDFNTVYVRLTHKRQIAYIKTSLLATKKQLRGYIVKDNILLIQTNSIIKGYVEKMNAIDSKHMTVKEVKQFLLSKDKEPEISFTDFYKKYILEMGRQGRENPAKNFRTALNSLKIFLSGNKNINELKDFNINFSDLKVATIREWVKTLEHTARAKNLYPGKIKVVFDAGLEKYNDYDTGVLRIKNNPFRKGVIPSEDTPIKRSLPVDVVKKILSHHPTTDRGKLAQNVVKLIIHLAGINTVDLFMMQKSSYCRQKLSYCRHKSTSTRKDRAYFEITIPDEVLPILEIYQSTGENLFSFPEMYSDFNAFNKAVNIGLKSIKDELQLTQNVTSYSFRHTWANIAKNDLGTSTETLAFCLNHTSAHKVTEMYFQKDFSPVDELNRRVIDFINL